MWNQITSLDSLNVGTRILCIDKAVVKVSSQGLPVLPLKSDLVLSWRVHACCAWALSPNSAFLHVPSLRD